MLEFSVFKLPMFLANYMQHALGLLLFTFKSVAHAAHTYHVRKADKGKDYA